ncbi:MAG: arginine--tRNA ligase [Bacteroidales bacterium]|nr:arginine--tRNA ligase [Bacteroidales bacterium]
MNPETFIFEKAKAAIKELYGAEVNEKMIQTQATRKEFTGDITLVTFPLLKTSKKSPEITAQEIGGWMKANSPEIESFNVIKGFLNIKFSQWFWQGIFNGMFATEDFGQLAPSGKTIMVEYSSPNTNKPLHLGHIRNNLLGWSVSKLLEANGHKVLKVNLVNDRGIHICKSMLAWLLMGNGETPESSGLKGDHLVGKYYVAFSNELKRQTKEIAAQENISEDEAEKKAPILREAQAMLLKWEHGDKEVVALWEKMNGWVYDGFAQTYKRLGIEFDRTYYESQTYLLGKALVQEGLKKNIFETHDDNSVWCDLEGDGLDKKLLLRGDGTSVYMTQDLGTAHQRFSEYKLDEHIYVVGNEQNYHFQVLKLILKKLGFDWSDSIYHLSYGMVELPEGKMKSREGTVVDADDLVEKMYQTAKETSLELGKLGDMGADEQEALFEMLGLGALKYFIIKVDPKKTMLFDPKESIDFNGNTGPFIQYTHARIKSILRRAAAEGYQKAVVDPESVKESASEILLPKEIEIIKLLNTFPTVIKEAGDAHSPAVVANYAYELAKEFNQYYHDVTILKEEDASLRDQRLALIDLIARVLVKAMGILGITLPERM